MSRLDIFQVRSNRVKKVLVLILFFFLIGCTIFIPIILLELDLPFFSIRADNKENHQPIELFGFLISFLLIGIAYINRRSIKKQPLSETIPTIAAILIPFYFLYIVTEYSIESTDYSAYKGAAGAIVDGTNPYIPAPNSSPYIYPPLFAQLMGLIYKLVDLTFQLNIEEEWDAVFYIYQTLQFFSVVLAYFLTYYLAQRMGLGKTASALVVSALFIFNNPIIRTFVYNQVNFWLLDSFLIAILLLQSYPIVAGSALSVGAHIKLYPFILLLPWAITRQKLAFVGAIASFVLIVLIQTSWGSDWELWQQFQIYFKDIQRPVDFRNNSLSSIAYNFSTILSLIPGVSAALLSKVRITFAAGITFASIVWLALRFVRREKVYYAASEAKSKISKRPWHHNYRIYGHSMDAIAFSLMISPSVWEHHYVIAIPIAVWAIATCEDKRFWQAFLGAFLIFCPSTFDVFPFSYHRILGLILLMYLTSPTMLKGYFEQLDAKNPIISRS